jgi:hypothetical protein
MLALARCEASIESARALVLAAQDGVITSRMTALEREWRLLARSDPDAGLMDLWARISPSAWLDRKCWRDSPPLARLDLVVAIAADSRGVAAAEAALAELRLSLSEWGTVVGSRTRWRAFTEDFGLGEAWLAEPVRAARAALSDRGVEAAAVERARWLENEILRAAKARFPERPQLVRDLANAVFADSLLQGAALAPRANPLTALRKLCEAGYWLSSIDETGATLEVAAL